MEHSSGLKRMHQIWKGICQSMFQLTKKLYSATIQKVLAHFAVQAECIAEGTQHTGSFHKKIAKYALHVIAPALGVAALTVSFGFAMQSANGVQCIRTRKTKLFTGNRLK